MSWRLWSWIIAAVLTLAGLGLIWWQTGTGLGALRWALPLVVAGVLIGVASTWTVAIELARRTANEDFANEKTALERLRAIERDKQQKAWDDITQARKAVHNAAETLSQDKAQVRQALAQAEADKARAQRQVESAERRRQNATAAAARMRRKLKRD
jgi:gas vesicle protein